MGGRIFVPTQRPEDWRRLLASPEKQWRAGYSARAAAENWEAATGLPDEIAAVFAHAGIGPTELLFAVPEWKTPLPGGSRESQTDIFALIKSQEGIYATAVEAKVSEPFGPTVAEWLVNASSGKLERLAFLKGLLGLGDRVENLRYQLLHRTAAALIEADRFRSAGAAMIVQSFSRENAWRDDFEAFESELKSATASTSRSVITTPGGRPLLIGWASAN